MCSPESPATQPYLADTEILLLYIRVEVSNHTIEIGSRNIFTDTMPSRKPPKACPFSLSVIILLSRSGRNRSLLAGEEFFRFGTSLILACGTPQAHLQGARLAGSKVRLCEVGERLDEHGAAVKAVHPLDSICVPTLTNDFNVKLVQRFNVIRGECDWNKNQVFLAFFDIVLDCVRSLRTQPSLRTDLRLPA